MSVPVVHHARRSALNFIGAFQIMVSLLGCTGGNEFSSTNKKSTEPPPTQVTATQTKDAPQGRAKKTPKIVPVFTDVAHDLGVDFSFFPDAVPGRYFLPEVMGGGAGWLDYDLDGRLDLCLRDGCSLRSPDQDVTEHVTRLYRNEASRFADVTLPSGAGFHGYGQGCAVGDFDCDGFPDLFYANFGANALFKNLGDGTFQDVSQDAGIMDDRWASSAIWLDVDSDADLDLYVVNYMDVSFANYRICNYDNVPGYCGPGEYEGVDDLVYINDGTGRFVESGTAMGFKAERGKGLAVAAVDFDMDLVPEIYVANDMTPKFLFVREKQVGSPGTELEFAL